MCLPYACCSVAQWANAAAHGRAYVKGSNLPTTGRIFAAVNLSFPSRGPTGPTSMLLRFNAEDHAIGPGADDFFGYEVALAPGVASLGYHAHEYVALNHTVVGAAVVGKPLLFRVELEQSSTRLAFTFMIGGKVVASFVHENARQIKAVSGGSVAVRGFQGLASFEGLEFGSVH